MADCQFDPAAIASWADRKQVCFLSDAQRQDAYFRAMPFILEQIKALIQEGWTSRAYPNDYGILLDITYHHEDRFALPSTFNGFLDPCRRDTWHAIFTNSELFLAAYEDEDEIDLFIDSSAPLCNIFYLLQVIAPGMLVIHRDAEEIDTNGIEDVFMPALWRVLPRKSWIEEHRQSLEQVMGNTEVMEALLSAAEDQNIAYDHDSRFDEQGHLHDLCYDEGFFVDMSGNRQPYDFTACSTECAYCGQCVYEGFYEDVEDVEDVEDIEVP